MTVVYTRWKFISVSCPSPELCSPGHDVVILLHRFLGVASCAHSSRRLLNVSHHACVPGSRLEERSKGGSKGRIWNLQRTLSLMFH